MNLGDSCQLFRRCRSLAEPPTLAAAEIHPFTTVVRNGDHGWLTSHIAPHFCLYRIDCLSELGSILTGIMKESHAAAAVVC